MLKMFLMLLLLKLFSLLLLELLLPLFDSVVVFIVVVAINVSQHLLSLQTINKPFSKLIESTI